MSNRQIFFFLVTLTVAAVLPLYLPWWSPVAVFFHFGLFAQLKAGKAFAFCFFGNAAVVTLLSLFQTVSTQSALAGRMASLFSLPHAFFIYAVSACIFGLLAALFAVSGVKLAALSK